MVYWFINHDCNNKEIIIITKDFDFKIQLKISCIMSPAAVFF